MPSDRTVRVADGSARDLVGLLAVLDGALLAGVVEPHLVAHLERRLQRQPAIGALHDRLDALIAELRDALGEGHA